MLRQPSNRTSTAALVVAVLALVVAGMGPAHAAISSLAPKSVGTKQLKDGAVTTAKLHGNAVTSAKVRDGSIGVSDLAVSARAPQVLVAADGGAHNVVPGSWVTVATMNVPAGKWLVEVKGNMYVYESQLTCDLVKGPDFILDRTIASLFTETATNSQAFSSLYLTNVTTLSAPTTLRVQCLQEYGTTAHVRDTKFVAIAAR